MISCTAELKTWLLNYFSTPTGQSLLKKLNIRELDQLLITFAELSSIRPQQGQHVIMHQHLQYDQLGLVFSALIGSLLGTKTSYITQKSELNVEILSQYFQVQALDLAQGQTLKEMDTCYSLIDDPELTDTLSFELYTVINTLLNAENSDLVMIDPQYPEVIELARTFGLNCIELSDIHAVYPDQINYKTLFWKRKSDENALICQQITQANVSVFEPLYSLKRSDLERLIDDFMYGEHLFEKISVLGEFSETILKNHHERLKKAC